MPDPTALTEWFKILFFLAGGAASLVGIAVGIQRLRAKPPAPTELRQPVIVQGAQQFVTAEACEKEHQRIQAELARHSASRKQIYEKLEEQSAQISALQTSAHQQSMDVADLKDSVGQINNRIDAIPGRTIALLKDTKGLI